MTVRRVVASRGITTLARVATAAVALALLCAVSVSADALLRPFNLTFVYLGNINDAYLPRVNSDGTEATPFKFATDAGNTTGGSARALTAINTLRARWDDDHVVVATVGSYAFGSFFQRIGHGRLEADYLIAMGVDVVGTHNGEWYNMDTVPSFLDAVSQSKRDGKGELAVVCSNVVSSLGPPLVRLSDAVMNLSQSYIHAYTDPNDPDTVIDRVGFIALLDPSTVYNSLLYSYLSASGYIEDQATAARREVEKLHNAGVNKIILLLQYDQYMRTVVPTVSGIDAVLVTSDNNPTKHEIVILTSPSGVPVPVFYCPSNLQHVCFTRLHFDEFGVLQTRYNAGGSLWTNGSIVLNQFVSADPDLVNRTASDYHLYIEPIFSTVIGYSPAFQDVAGIRYQERALGNILCDGLRSGVGSGVHFAFLNSGGIRASLAAGPVTFGSLIAILPFQNTLVMFRVRGDVIVQMLENSLSRLCIGQDTPSGNGRFLQMSGLDIGFSGCQPVGTRLTYVRVWSPLDTNGTLHSLKRPLNLTELYTIVLNQFQGSGGDEYTMLVNNTGKVIPVTGFSQPRQEFVIQKYWESVHSVYQPVNADPKWQRIANDSSTVPPQIVSVSPTTGPMNGGFTLTVYGRGLTTDPDVGLRLRLGTTVGSGLRSNSADETGGGVECKIESDAPGPYPAGTNSGVLCSMGDATELLSGVSGVSAFITASAKSKLSGEYTVRRSTGGDSTHPNALAVIGFTFTAPNLPCPPNAAFVASAYACQCVEPYVAAPGNEVSCRTTGDELAQSRDPNAIVLAIVVPALGAWTALTFFDQAINVSILRFRYTLSALSSLVLGLSIWATISFGLTSITLPASLGWTASTLMCGLLVAVPSSVLFVFYTLFYVATPFLAKLTEKKPLGLRTHTHSHTKEFSGANSMISRAETLMTHNEYEFIDVSDRNDLKKTNATFSFSVSFFIAAYLLVQAIAATHYLTFASTRLQGSYEFSIPFIVVAFVGTYLLAAGTLWSWFHWFQSGARLISVGCCTLSVVFFYFVSTAGMTFKFDADADYHLDGDRVVVWSVDSVRLAGGVVTFLSILIFLALTVTRVKLSKDELFRMAQLLRTQLSQCKDSLEEEKSIVAEQRQWLRLIALTRPLHNAKHFQLKLLEKEMAERVEKEKDKDGQRSVKFSKTEPSPHASATTSADSPLAAGAAAAAAGATTTSPTSGPAAGMALTVPTAGEHKHNPSGGGGSMLFFGGNNPAGITGNTSPLAGTGSVAGAHRVASSLHAPGDPTLLEVCHHPATLEILKDQMLEHQTLESLAFYLDVQAYKALDKSRRMLALPDIIDTYIRATAPYQINIDGTLMTRILSRYDKSVAAQKAKRDLFIEAEKETLRLMETNDFPRLKQSEFWPIVRIVLKHKREIGLSNILAQRATGGAQFERSVSTSKFPSTIATVDAHTVGRHGSTTEGLDHAPGLNRLATTSVVSPLPGTGSGKSVAVGGLSSWKSRQQQLVGMPGASAPGAATTGGLVLRPSASVAAAPISAAEAEAAEVAAAAVARFQFRRGSSVHPATHGADALYNHSPKHHSPHEHSRGIELTATGSASGKHKPPASPNGAAAVAAGIAGGSGAVHPVALPRVISEEEAPSATATAKLGQLLDSKLPASDAATSSLTRAPSIASGGPARSGSIHLPPLSGGSGRASPLGSLHGVATATSPTTATAITSPANVTVSPATAANPLPGATLQ